MSTINKKIPVAAHLNDYEYKLLLKVYSKHNCSMDLKKREKYSLSNIVKVERNTEENCLNVHYKNGDWWHYCTDGTWY